MPLTIEAPDGTNLNAQGPAPKSRTLMDIAKEVDAATARLAGATREVDSARSDLARLNVEVRAFGRKPRKAKP